MAGEVFSSTAARALKRTLNTIVDDSSDNLESKSVMKRFCKVSTMEDQYEDDVEYGGGGLVAQKPEGNELAVITMKQGYTTRYIAQTYGAKMIITEEAIEDVKYKEVIDLARRLKRSMWKTIDIDATLMLMRATNTAYPGGDGLPLASAVHTLPNGGTFSNTMATPLSPSRQAVVVAATQAGLLPGHDGLIEGYTLTKVVFPLAQWAVWSALTKSKMTPEMGNFAEINVVNSDLDIEPVPNKYWSNTSTNYCFITDADNGLNFRFRRKPRGKSWVENDNEIMKYSTSARWDRRWSDPRGTLFVNA